MKLRNKKTGEIRELSVDMDRPDNGIRVYADDGINYRMYNSLAQLNEEWEDYEEPKECYYIDPSFEKDYCRVTTEHCSDIVERAKELGIGFETKEEAKKAVEKLKAWKRLKDKGFQFAGVFSENMIDFEISDGGKKWNDKQIKEFEEDLQLLFGGEE